jgi:hypothetical protein
MTGNQHSNTDDPADADLVVCMRYEAPQRLILPDNATGTCSHCGHAIQYRPDVPAGPAKICMQCAIDLVRTRH